MLLLFFAPPIYAQTIGKVIQPFGSYIFTADDNILRIRDKMNTDSIANDSIRNAIIQKDLFDMTHRFTGGVILQKEISRQRLSANFNYSRVQFDRFSIMDNNLKNFSGNWNWLIGNQLEGNMGASYTQSLAPFLFQPGIKSIRTELTEYINGGWRFHPRWRLNGEFTHYDLGIKAPPEVPRLRFLERTENQFEGGIDYVSSHGKSGRNTVGVLFRHISGNFPFEPTSAFINNDYEQKEVMAKINWDVTGKSSFQVRGGWVERQNASAVQRDFSGFNARGIFQWRPTDKTGLTVSGWRETAARQNLTASFSINTGVSVIPFWNITEKVRMEGDFLYETRNFGNRVTNLSDPEISSALGVHNTIRNATVRLVYNPYLGLELSASAYHADLKSDSFFGGFNANGANVNLQYTYGQR
ncbi:XrtB/PEP-CTERM-associated polysaccharide biosynthesis outer membrane protein EpsL [Nitrosomonas supralitoralis]|nr:XrtB/PEP-CTERM-associated polysaccharide biosynthesis outer membrane protein EpsL [Nitrosomonas supralitoralis]